MLSDNNEPVADHNTRATLERLLTQMIETPGRRAELTAEVDRIFGQDKAILVLDMSGFSRTTRRHGIVAFLLMIHQMKLLAVPAITAAGGILVKSEADNLFCLFDDVAPAIAAARDIGQRLSTVNVLLPEDQRLHASIGIGYGRVLNVEDEDLFGDEVNLACKLGEDIAGRGVVLLTERAHSRLADASIRTREDEISVSGISLVYYEVQ